MRPIDMIPGFRPKREAVQQPDGNWLVTVTPPDFMKVSGSSVLLTEDQHTRYAIWMDSGDMIQNMLPDLSIDEREILMSGLGPQQFANIHADDD